MKTTVRHIIFEFSLNLFSNGDFELGIFGSDKVDYSKDLSVYGFFLGESTDFINNKVIFYN